MLFLFQILFNAIHLYSILLLIYALLSWFPGAYQTALGRGLRALVAPILRPLSKLPLQFGGFDFSVLAAMILLNGLTSLLQRLLYLFL